MTTTLARIAAATLATLGVVGGFLSPSVAQSAAADEGSIGIRLLDAPVERRDDVRARYYIIDHLTPGSTIERRVEVTNTTPDPAEVALYAAGARVNGGKFVFLDGRQGNDLARWTTVKPSNVTVAADEAVEGTVRITVPPDASEGERYGVIWAEVRAAGSGDVAAINRVGIRMYLSVGPGGEPPSEFIITSLRPGRTQQGAFQITANVHNTGGRALDLRGKLSLSEGPAGLSAGPFEAELGTTAAVGERIGVVFILNPQLPDGPWTADVTLRSGQVERKASATITLPARGTGPPVQPSSPNTFWIALAIVVLVAVLAAGLLIRRYRSNNRPPSTH